MKLSSHRFTKHLLAASLIAGFGMTAFAQNATPGTPAEGRGAMHQMGKMSAEGKGQGMGQGQMHERMQAHRQARAEKRLTALKAKLKITAAQEGAWTTFSTAMKPATNAKGPMGMRHDPAQRAEMEKLTTPERIEKMRALRQGHQTQMNAEMDKRADATKAFYAVLSSEQKAVFDAVAMQGGHGGPGDHRGMMGGHRGDHGGMGDHMGGKGRAH